jgi:hypothetical protein
MIFRLAGGQAFAWEPCRFRKDSSERGQGFQRLRFSKAYSENESSKEKSAKHLPPIARIR